MEAIKALLLNPVFVLTACFAIDQIGPMVLNALEMFPEPYRKPIAFGVAVAGALARAAKWGVDLAVKKKDIEKKSEALAKEAQHSVDGAP